MNTSRALTLFLALALLGFVFLALSTPTARAADPVIVRVTASGTTTWPCGDQSNWSNTCALQTALTNTVSGSELWVAAGTYTPTTGTDRTLSFQLRDGIALYGGFAGSETLRSQRNITANVTVLSGDLNGDDNGNVQYDEPTRADNAYHVVTGSGVTNTAVLDGFTVTGGNADVVSQFDPNSRGGGMYDDNGNPTVRNVIFFGNFAEYFGAGMHNSNNSSPSLTNVTFSGNRAHDFGGGMYNESNSNPTLIDVTFSGNWATAIGGAMYNDSSSPTLTNVTFSTNSSSYGGGMYGWNSSPTLTNVTFSGNSASETGGGMDNNENSNPTLTNVTFSGNSAGYRGGGMNNWSASNPTLTNVTFSGNSAAHYGGGMANIISGPTLTNVTFSGNSASERGGAMYNTSSYPTVRNAVLWGNTAPNDPEVYNDVSTPKLNDSVVQGGCPAYSTCDDNIITTDPRLGALGDWGGSTQTIPLLPGSSAIDAANATFCPSTDQRGKPRFGPCDIGAFEFQGSTLTKTGGDQQSTLVNTPFASSLQVTLTEIDSALPLPGIVVTFTAPSSGASAAWSGNLVVTATTNASGVATVGPPTANGIAGSYTVTATTSGANPPASFALTNTKHDTITVITSSENPVLVNHPVTLTVTVSAVPPGSTMPTGTVELSETTGAAAALRETRRALASKPLVDGVATFSLPSLTAGAHTFVATYSGDANFNASSSATYTQTVGLLYDYLPLIRK